MKPNTFSQQLLAAQQRLEALLQQAGELPEAQVRPLLAAALQELAINLEELQAVGEELHQQNEALAAVHQTIEAERQRYQNLFDLAPDGYLVTTREGIIQAANQAAAALLGITQRYLVGKPLVVFVALDDRPAFRGRLAQLLAAPGEASQSQHWEIRMQSRSRGSFWATLTVALVRKVGGGPLTLRWFLRDMTEYKQVEAALQESEAFNRSIINSLAEHIAVLDGVGLIIAVNRAWERFARENGGVFRTGVGVNYLEVCRQADPTKAPEALAALTGLQAVLEGSLDHFSLEYTCHSPAEQRWFVLHASPLSNSHGGAVVLHLNITRRKQVEREKARLLEEVTQQREQLRALSRQLAEIQESERKQLAQELHDQVGRTLTALNLNLNIIRSQLGAVAPEAELILPRLDDSLALVEETSERVRDVMAHLRPPVLDDYGLVAALRWYSVRFAEWSGLRILVEGEEPVPRLAAPVENALFRIVQEALINVVKHAQASQIKVIVETHNSLIRLTVADDGLGFEPALLPPPSGRQGWGMLTMAERAEAVGGRCLVNSRPGEGTQIIVELIR